MATRTMKKNNKTSTIGLLRDKVAGLHEVALKTTETMVEETIATGEQWQNLLARTLKKGTSLFGKQQDLMLTGLEMLKDQYVYGNKRLRRLLTPGPIDSKTLKPTTRKSAAIGKTVKNIDQVMEAATSSPGKKKAKTRPATAPKNQPMPAAKKSSATAKVKKTDLTIIEGIGPKIREILNNAGIVTLDQLATANPANLKKILVNAGTRFQMHDPSTWPAQAKLAASGKMEELKVLQTQLKGGK